MTYATTSPNRSAKIEVDATMFFDPTLIKAARKIYQTYCNFHDRLQTKPLGVIIDCETYKGQLTFRQRPILLPGERFIRMDLIETETL